ncbi:NAD(P)-binding protein [Lindgomyces ingoldianus]|uniref:NAD(P)-binding protein n=1 Tax=Lindgomyces ingoldianus TaxID=673940 RepID=A0ACB6RA83_9PLEO|nr:NAD(P)-binding protein [Lindgomyces ingoldianus]KAF2476174.1 NAD(P)-binding protein [Lindgomyces ingoldianus]
MASAPLPPAMKAWTFSKSGPHRKVLQLTNLPTPRPPTGSQVLIKVAYVGVSPSDTKLMNLFPSIFVRANSTPGAEFSGTVLARGPDAQEDLQVGIKTFGMLPRESHFRGYGTYCEYICLDTKTSALAVVPGALTMAEASVIGAGGVMAFLIHKYGKVPEHNDYRILVNGASGGCGSMFVQAAVALGAKEVVGTCSAPNVEMAKSLGASRVIDYRANAPLHQYLAKEFGDRPFDFVLDTVGAQDLYRNSKGFLKEGSIFLNIGDYMHGTYWTLWYIFVNMFWPAWFGGTPRKYVFFSGYPDHASLERLVGFVKEGKMKVNVEKVFAWEDVLDALDLINTKRVRGKIVLKVGGD